MQVTTLFSRLVFGATLLLSSSQALAAVTVGLAIENDVDVHGGIVVPTGSKLRVAYEVLEDTDKELNKKNRIELVHVDNDEVVFAAERGKKKSGAVSLKVKTSGYVELDLRSVQKGSNKDITRSSHPEDVEPVALYSIPAMSLNELVVALNAAKKGAVSVPGVAFDDEAGGSGDCIDTRNDGTGYFFFAGSGSSCDASAPVSFPEGVDLSSIACRVLDNTATNAVTIRLTRTKLKPPSSSSDIFMTSTSSNSGSDTQIIDDRNPVNGLQTVDNSNLAYYLRADFGIQAPGSNLRIHGCSIAYSPI